MCYVWPWLGPPLTTVQYVVYFPFVDDVTFSHNRPNMDTGLESAMQQIIHRVSPGGATKLHTPGAKSAIIPDCLVTSLAGAVAKYCDEHVCVSVCLSTSLSPE